MLSVFEKVFYSLSISFQKLPMLKKEAITLTPEEGILYKYMVIKTRCIFHNVTQFQ